MAAVIERLFRHGAAEWTVVAYGIAPLRFFYEGAEYFPRFETKENYIEGQGGRVMFRIFKPENPTVEPLIDVRENSVDDIALPEQMAYPQTIVLQWRGSADARMYWVQEYTGGEWVTRRTIYDENQGYFRFDSGVMASETTANWRVIVVDHFGYTSIASNFETFVIRNPDPPAFSISYAAGVVTVSEA